MARSKPTRGEIAAHTRASKRMSNSLVGDPSLRVAARDAAQGVSGTTVFGGFVRNRETSSDLWGAARYTTMTNLMLNTTVVASGVRYVLNLMGRPSWKFDPADDSDEAKKYADLVAKALLVDLQTPWSNVVRKAAMFRFWGFSIQEHSMARAKEGHMAIVDIESRPQRTIERWDVDMTGTIFAVGQRSPHDGELKPMPRSKLLYLVDDALDDSPEGVGVLRQVANACRELQRYTQLEGWGFETDLRGMPVVRIPYVLLAKLVKDGTLTAEQRDRIVRPLEEIAENHIRTPELGVILDSYVYTSAGEDQTPSAVPAFDIQTIKGSNGEGQQAVGNAIERVNWEIARVLGTETLLLGANGRGSYALSEDKTSNTLAVIDGMLDDTAKAVRRDIITRMFIKNGWPLDKLPRVSTDAVQYRSAKEIAETLEKLAKAGATLDPLDPAINIVHNAMGLPNAPEVRVDDIVQQRVQELMPKPKLPAPGGDKPAAGAKKE